jgi:hypothetical protein
MRLCSFALAECRQEWCVADQKLEERAEAWRSSRKVGYALQLTSNQISVPSDESDTMRDVRPRERFNVLVRKWSVSETKEVRQKAEKAGHISTHLTYREVARKQANKVTL